MRGAILYFLFPDHLERNLSRDHNHVAHCVADAFTSGDADAQRQKVEELVETMARMTR